MRYDAITQTYDVDGHKVNRRELLEVLGVRHPDLAQDMLTCFERIYAEQHNGEPIPNNVRHLCLMRYISDRELPTWMFDAYKNRNAKVHQLRAPKSKP